VIDVSEEQQPEKWTDEGNNVENRGLRTPGADSGVVRLRRYRSVGRILPDGKPDRAANRLSEGGRKGELLEMAKSGGVVDARAAGWGLGHHVVCRMLTGQTRLLRNASG